jgi:hypothetical protein
MRFCTVRRINSLLLGVSILLASMASAGCGDKEEWNQFWSQWEEKGEQPAPAPVMDSRGKGLQGTIGQLVTIDGLRLLRVNGYGLVTGLVDSGGADGPKVVKDYLVKEIRRMQEIGEPGMPAGDILGSKDSAIVAVSGWIKPGAKKGDRFDVVIDAMGAQAKSLVGGRLVLCDLKLFAETPQGIIEGKILARADGPVFVSPFDRAGRPTSNVDLRKAMVLGGGIVKEPRKIRLLLTDPRYSVAQQIENRINSRYSVVDPIADAMSAGSLDLKIPDESDDRKRIFLERIMHTTINGSTPFLEQRARELGDEMTDSDAEYETIGLAWEAIGKLALPHIRKHYATESPEISFFAGRTGLRLGDKEGMRTVGRHALNLKSPFRVQAIDELGYATDMSAAGEVLRKTLDDADTDIRIRAYLAIRRHATPTVETYVLDRDNAVLDVLDSGGPFLVYVQRLGSPRVALFGRQMRCDPPAIFPDLQYRNDDRFLHLLITAQAKDEKLSVIYKNRANGQTSPKLDGPLGVADLVRFLGDRFELNAEGRPESLAVPYAEVIDVLGAFCKSKTIAATFVTDEMTVDPDDDLDSGKERPESEY